ncbi:hypothetical protein IQ216_12685 [Cyanobium sp. LEGE 06143]|uniref:hypothetical protein n=1 Tax=unclassified Cyanobium TaxID=2627006 RepID=UPI00164921A9|nr:MULTISPECIES: hypothetical protein [unclassified Cyanobium]MBE9173892.1 hypothetical protein [Cyanobium sp. LEGE 06143]QNI71266.1 hypothetical protein CyaNS01_02142 [Cyanobium sp. NS01]
MAPGHDDPRQHPWWQHVPAADKRGVQRRRRWRRLGTALGSRSGQLALLLGLYLAIALGMLRAGAGPITLLVVLPLVLLPALAGLAYWLMWKDFHH